jgi:putative flippase GtrA
MLLLWPKRSLKKCWRTETIIKAQLLEIYNKHPQLILYGLIGISGAILDFVVYIILYKYIGINPVIASFLSVTVGITNNFILNSRHNFKVKDKLLYRFANFYTIGLMGAVLSSFLILILFDGFKLNALLAKLLTIPPVVLLQYFLNKKYSFHKLDKKEFQNHFLYKLFSKHIWLVAINIIFITTALVFVTNKAPGQAGPDEETHYNYNVLYIIQHHALPVSGRDDLTLLKDCRNNGFAIVRCTYSYMSYPAANYAVSAVGSWTIHKSTGISYLNSARLTAVIEGVIFVNLIYLMVLRVTKSRQMSAVITASVALIPEVMLTVSYVNEDSHSLAISSIVVYALVRLIQDKDRKSLIIAGLAFGGLLPLAKFNFFILIPAVAVILLYSLIKKMISLALLYRLLAWCVVWFVVVAGYWYARNLYLYHDLLGQSFALKEMAKFHAQGKAQPLSILTLQQVTQLNYFDIQFKSFYVALGSMKYYMPDYMYGDIEFGLIGAIVLLFYISLKQVKALARHSALVIVGLLVFIGSNIFLSFQNSITYDLQPQGRYLFPILCMIALALAYLYKLNKEFRYVAFAYLFITIFAFVGSIDVIIRNVLVT